MVFFEKFFLQTGRNYVANLIEIIKIGKKMKKYLLIPIIILIMISMNGCSKDDENSLTSPSTNGKGTLSFLLDGIVWKPKTSFNFPTMMYSHAMFVEPQILDSTGNRVNDLVKITIVANRNEGLEDLEFFADDILGLGVYQIKNARFWLEKKSYFLDTLINDKNFFEITNISKDYIDAYFNTATNKIMAGRYSGNTIISGKFEIHLVSNTGQKMQITDGRFDLKNQAYTDY